MSLCPTLLWLNIIGSSGRTTGDGYLSNIPPSLYRQFFEPSLPETMRGSEFLEKFGDHWDTATQIEADLEYPVAQATQHAIQENFRVHAFRAALTSQEPDLDRKSVV